MQRNTQEEEEEVEEEEKTNRRQHQTNIRQDFYAQDGDIRATQAHIIM